MNRRLNLPQDMCETELMETYSFHLRESHLQQKESAYVLELREEVEKRLRAYDQSFKETNEEIGTLKRAKDMSNDELLKTFDDYVKIPFRLNEEQEYLGSLSREVKRRIKYDKEKNNEVETD